MKDKTLVILVGAPGSGKSTWRRKWHGAYVNPDAIRREKFGVQYDRQVEPAVWKIAYAQLEKAMGEGLDVCFDATSLNPEARRPLIKMADRYGYKKKAVYFAVSLKTLLQRNEARPPGKILAAEIIAGLYMRLKAPEMEEGFTEIEVIKEEDQDGEEEQDGEVRSELKGKGHKKGKPKK